MAGNTAIIVDADVVDASNLQRQILHGESWIGKPKLESAAARLREITGRALANLARRGSLPGPAAAIVEFEPVRRPGSLKRRSEP